jgi:hypothetical protein
MRNSHSRTLEYGEKHSKTWKMRNAHCRTWNVARKLKNMENETEILFDLEYVEKFENHGK